jgi:two-component system, sporulation sensor kinase E
MRKFLEKALQKWEKLDRESIRRLFAHIGADNELLEMVLHSMTDGVMVTDRDNNILLFNKASERLIPLVAADIMEKKIWEALDDDELAGFFREKLTNQETIRDKNFVLGGGIARTISVSIMPLVKEGKIQGNLIHIEDITEKKLNQARLRRAESLAALTTLAAGVAHEIKNPLGSIGIHLQLAQKEMNKKQTIKTKSIRHYLDVINEEVDRLNRIVVDFLFAVRPMDMKLEEGDLNQLVRELLDFLKFELEQAHVKIETELARNLPKILMDDKYMKQALLNLIKNSLSAMPKGGILRIETVRRGPDVVLRLIDNGCGIPDAIMDKIFEPYFTTKEFGSGLGLTLVYKIIKEHLGEVSLTSKQGEGTTFILTFSIPQKEKRLLEYEGEEDEI